MPGPIDGPVVAICAMGKRPFTEIAGRWVTQLRAAGVHTLDHRAVLVRRDVVIEDLNGNADIVIYLGHGRPCGWSGYQTIRTSHFEGTIARRPVQAVFAFACDTAGPGVEGPTFAQQLVTSARVCSYIGWAHPAQLDTGLIVADRCVSALAATLPNLSIDDVLHQLMSAAADKAEREMVGQLVVLGESTTARQAA